MTTKAPEVLKKVNTILWIVLLVTNYLCYPLDFGLFGL